MKDDIKKLGFNPFYHKAIPTKKECERIKKETEKFRKHFNKKVAPLFEELVKQILKEMKREANNPPSNSDK